MATNRARQWSYFIVNKLGLPYKKAEIERFADSKEDDAVWNKFIASKKEYLDAAEANNIGGPDDVFRFFRDASYASMRGTFPARSNGRTIIGPRIVSLQKLREQEGKAETEGNKYRVRLSESDELKDIIGKTIFHSADNGLVYGKGIVIGINEKRDTFTVEFENGDKRTLGYKYCLDKGIIRFL